MTKRQAVIVNRSNSGSVLIMVLFLLVCVSVLCMAVAAFTIQKMSSSASGRNKASGLTLAEAGVDDALNNLTNNRNATSASGTMYEDNGNSIVFGTYAAAITNTDSSGMNKKVISVGRNRNGTQRTVVALIKIEARPLGSGAMMANGTISVSSNTNILTTPLNAHVADVYANSNVTLGGTGNVDGRLISAQTAYGTAYYPSVSNAPQLVFPDAAEISAMQTQWYTDSRSTNNIINVSTLFPSNKSNVTVIAPAFINGDLTLQSGKTLNFTGNGFIYINGNLRLNSQATLNNGSTLVVGGSYNQNGQGMYRTTTGVIPAPTLAVSTGDISLNGGASNSQWGVIYAVSGSVRVNGNAVFTGALVSGQQSGGIVATGTYDQYFPVDMASKITLPGPPYVTHVAEL